VSLFEKLDSSTSGGFELKNRLSVIGCFGVNDDVEIHFASIHDALQGYFDVVCLVLTICEIILRSKLTRKMDPDVIAARKTREIQLRQQFKRSSHVLKILNLRIALKSSTCSDGTCAISRRRTVPS
jgi:hypothetical protein